MEKVFLGRQPILDRNKNLVAFELFFRLDQMPKDGNVDHERSATANVIVNAYGHLGIQNVLGQQRGFINVDNALVMNDVISLLPSKHVVLEIKGITEFTDDLNKRCAELKHAGYQLALDGVVSINENIERILPLINIVKIDISALEKDDLAYLANKLKRWPVLLLAEKVETQEQANSCMELGFEMFQGYYYAKPQIIAGKRADPSKLSLLRLLTLVMGDSDIDEIDREFKRQPSLSYNLMRMVNSAACGLPQKVNSIKQSIMFLGRKQLQRWIQLLLYTVEASGNSDNMPNALMQTAAMRGKLMELIAATERPHDKNHQERAFMVGILSLLDTLLCIEMQKIVDKLGIPDDMSLALLSREGRLGQELKLIEANETGELTTIQSMLSVLSFLSLEELTNLEVEALGWVNKIGEAAD